MFFGSIVHTAWKFTAGTGEKSTLFSLQSLIWLQMKKMYDGTVHTGAVNNSLCYFKGQKKKYFKALNMFIGIYISSLI